jgi:hypothetical protein
LRRRNASGDDRRTAEPFQLRDIAVGLALAVLAHGGPVGGFATEVGRG